MAVQVPWGSGEKRTRIGDPQGLHFSFPITLWPYRLGPSELQFLWLSDGVDNDNIMQME